MCRKPILKFIRYLFFILLITQPAVAQVDLSLGLRAYYPFSGNANDASGNNNNPVFNNATLTADRLGNPNSACAFNGSSSFIRIPNSPTLNAGTQMTLCAWVKVSGFYQGTCHDNSILMKGDADNLAGNYLLRFSDNLFTNHQNCLLPLPDEQHETFLGHNTTVNVPHPDPFVQLNRWYSLVWTYDGVTSRLYVNCVLARQGTTALSFTNSFDLFLGKMNHPQYPYWFNGVMDEVRIYNRVLTADEINSYGNCPLAAGASIGGIINSYTPVNGFNPCDNKLTVEDAGSFNTGDTVLMIQMKGAVIDSTNTASFGMITDYKNAGNYEINYIKSKSGNTIELKNIPLRSYDIPNGKVQLVRVPSYTNAIINSPLTCLAWDGSKGGILALNVSDSLVLNANIDVSGKGFNGGIDPVSTQSTYNCYENQYYYPPNPSLSSGKGEGIALISAARSFGKGALANGGGSGSSHNSGAAGGGNGGNGGKGGYNYEGPPCNTTIPFDNGGIGGRALTYTTATNRLYLGGGGGAGQTNSGIFQGNGGNGGGIIILTAGKIRANTNKIVSNGTDAAVCGNTGPDCHEGMGGGGAGGTILLGVSNYLDNLAAEAKGGKGGDMTAVGLARIGPGGGGGGGMIAVTNAVLPPAITVNYSGGPNGVCPDHANDPWGTTPGQTGLQLTGLSIPITGTLFKPNIDSIRIRDSLLDCDRFNFNGNGYTNTHPVASWNWFFGDGGTANTQNSPHTFNPGTYTVKLVVTDINGCKDSTTRIVTASVLQVDAGNPATICTGQSTVLQAMSNPAATYQWSPNAQLSNPSQLNPTASPAVSTLYYLTATNAAGCQKKDSVQITVRPPASFSISSPVSICNGQNTQLSVTGGTGLFSWSPAASLTNPSVANPVASPAVTTLYQVQATDTACNLVTNLSTTVTVRPPPTIRAGKTNDIDCNTAQSRLTASGGQQYSWSPVTGLSNPNQSSPVATPTVTTQYILTGTDAFGCTNKDSVTVQVNLAGNPGSYLMPTGFTPNNDGKNDCYGIKYWGTIQELEFSIYNRWGERVFFTRNPNECWNGKYKGLKQPSSVFVYMIRAKTSCDPAVFRKGTFVLIR